MAIQRLTLTQIRNEILRIVGNYANSTFADWNTDANLYRIISMYGQQLSIRAAQAANGNLPPGKARLCFDMYKTTVNSAGSGTGLIVAAGSATVYLPVDYDQCISFYDRTNSRQIEVIYDVTKRHLEIKHEPAGPPKAIELLQYTTNGSNWQREARLYPPTASGVTPSIELYYYRLPAVMPGTDPDNEYVDADPKYQYLWIYGTATEVMRPNNPSYDRYKALETELLIDLAATGKAY